MSELNNLHEYKNVRVSSVDYDFSSNRHENIPHKLYADWAALIIKLAKAVNPSFSEPPFPEYLKFQTETIPSDGPYSASEDYYYLDYVFCELTSEKGCGIKISFEDGRWGGGEPVKMETLGIHPGVSSEIIREMSSPLASIYIWHTEEKTAKIAEIIARHPESFLAKPISSEVQNFSGKNEKCSLCGVLPDDLTVNTGRDQEFPRAFYQLKPVKFPGSLEKEHRRCPQCGDYFKWIDEPQMYGSGNNAEERMIRFPQKAKPLIDILLSPNAIDQPDLGRIDEYFKLIDYGLLSGLLYELASCRPKVFALFVPCLWQVSFLNKYPIKHILSAYISDIPERAEEVLESLRSLEAAGFYTYTNQALLYCFEITQKKQ